jgi:NAD(P)H-nitrite reductase large subunit
MVIYMYCLCSDSSFDTILERQRTKPLPRELMIEQYTGCSKGCGTCIPALLAEAEMLGLLPGSVEGCLG